MSGRQPGLFETGEGGSPEIRAAGLVVYRREAAGIEVLLLRHTGRRGWWAPPKGHLDPGEDDLTAALRETEEEAGLTAPPLRVDPAFRREVRYDVWEHGRRLPKVVVYFLAEAPAGAAARISHEHSDFTWLGPDEACERISYANLREVVRAALARIAEATPPPGEGAG